MSLIASSFDGGLCFMFLSRYSGVRVFRNFYRIVADNVSQLFLGERVLPVLLSSTLAFLACKKLLALRHVVQVAYR